MKCFAGSRPLVNQNLIRTNLKFKLFQNQTFVCKPNGTTSWPRCRSMCSNLEAKLFGLIGPKFCPNHPVAVWKPGSWITANDLNCKAVMGIPKEQKRVENLSWNTVSASHWTDFIHRCFLKRARLKMLRTQAESSGTRSLPFLKDFGKIFNSVKIKWIRTSDSKVHLALGRPESIRLT